MKNLIIILSFLVFNAHAQFKLNTNPKDPNRLPNGETEVGIVLSHNSPRITINDANGHLTTNYLPAGVLVIADKETRIADWVAICANDVVSPRNWRPEGKVIYFNSKDSYKNACEEMELVLSKLDKIQEGVDELLKRPYYSLYELKEATTTIISPNNHKWTYWNTGIPIIGGIIGGIVGGYGFRTTTITTVTDVTVKPGIRLQTGDGTIIFGPDKIIVNKHDIKTKKFNVGAAIGCGIASGLITYFLCEILF